MAYFSQVIDGIVSNVIRAEKEYIDSGAVGDPNSWIETCQNTKGNVCYNLETNEPCEGTPIRKNFGEVGFHYDAQADAFYAPKPFDSWSLNQETFLWEAPITKPESDHPWSWDEELYQSDNTKGWYYADYVNGEKIVTIA